MLFQHFRAHSIFILFFLSYYHLSSVLDLHLPAFSVHHYVFTKTSQLPPRQKKPVLAICSHRACGALVCEGLHIWVDQGDGLLGINQLILGLLQYVFRTCSVLSCFLHCNWGVHWFFFLLNNLDFLPVGLFTLSIKYIAFTKIYM